MVRAFLVMAFTVILCQSRAACQTPNKTEVDQRVVELAEKNAKTIARQSRSTVHLPRFRVPPQELGLGIVGENGQILRRIEKDSDEWQKYLESGQQGPGRP
jgi:hypothetical protein